MPEDKRPYIVVTDEMPDHPKVEALSDKAFRTLVTLWCRSHRLDTDGKVSAIQWKRVPAKVRVELLSAPLVEEQPDGTAVMRDYLDHNQSAAQREAGREKKRLAGAKGGAAKALAGARANAVAPASQSLKHLPSKPVAEGEGEGEGESSPTEKNPSSAPPRQLGLVPEADHDAGPSSFAIWYDAYPLHKGRGDAEKAYAQALKKATAETLLLGARRYAFEMAGKDPAYIKHPGPWLRAGRWADEATALPARPKFGISYGEADRAGPPVVMTGSEWAVDTPRSSA